jgi:uncharacterized membrane protein YadS
MSTPLVDTPHALDAAIAARLQLRRERLLRAERNRRILTPVAFGLSGCTAILALAAFFLARDREAARSCAAIACVSLSITTFAYFAAQSARMKAVDSAREMDQST